MMVAYSRRKYLLALIVMVLCLSTLAYLAEAHGEDKRIVVERAAVGPFALTVWVEPADLRPGEIHLTAAITDGEEPVLDCRVAFRILSLDRPASALYVEAGPALPVTDFRHEALLTLPHDGRYRFEITVRDPAGQGGRQQFDLFVRPVSTWMVVFIYSQFVFATIVGLWLMWEGIHLWPVWRKTTG